MLFTPQAGRPLRAGVETRAARPGPAGPGTRRAQRSRAELPAETPLAPAVAGAGAARGLALVSGADT